MPKYRRVATWCDAFRMGEDGRPTPTPEWFGSPPPHMITPEGVIVPTRGGHALARWGDWVVRDVDGYLAVHRPEEFERLYEPIAEEEGRAVRPDPMLPFGGPT
jgi:hypothetical protein